MGKKKKKKKQKNQNLGYGNYLMSNTKNQKSLDKEFKKALNEIEAAQIRLFEADKKARKKERKKINKHETEFYTSMQGIKCRQKIAKKWEKKGFFDTILDLLNEISPYVKKIAKLLCTFIITFLSLDVVKTKISPGSLSKISKIYDVASHI